jgi:cystathionine gamma-synthase
VLSVSSVANSSTLKHYPLGARIPDSTHAVVVSLPTMEAVVAYEEGCSETAKLLKTGYPRFKRHPYIERAAQFVAEKCGVAGRALFPVCSRRAAEDVVAYAAAKDARIDVVRGHVWYLVSLGAGEADAAERAKRYLQHTGVQISSRHAEDFLVSAGELPSAQPEELFSGDAESRILSTLAPYFAPAAKSDLTICRAGMNAFHAAFRATLDVQRAHGRTIWIQLGWLYLDTPAILQKFLGPDERHVFFSDVFDFAALEKFFDENAGKIAGVITEYPTNPLIRTGDIGKLSALCLKHGVARIFDPSSAGVVNVDVMPHSDLVVASLTKYSGNAGDVMLGVVAVNPASPFADQFRAGVAKYAEPGYARDLARLAAQIGRMESVADAINANTVKLAKWLESHPAVKRVHWAYSEKSAGHYAKIARGPNRPGSLFTIELNGPIGAFYDRLRCAKGPSFGTTFTIVCPFAYLAHYDLVTTAEGRRELLARDLDPELIRIAVGAEPFEEIRAVFEEALA